MLTSKSFWAGLGLAAFGIVTIVQGDVEHGIQLILEGLGIMGIRQAIARGQ